MCPSLWNNDSYWGPDALTALGPVCVPNYAPAADPQTWNTFLTCVRARMCALLCCVCVCACVVRACVRLCVLCVCVCA